MKSDTTPSFRVRKAIAELLFETRDFTRAKVTDEIIIHKLLPALNELEVICPRNQ